MEVATFPQLHGDRSVDENQASQESFVRIGLANNLTALCTMGNDSKRPAREQSSRGERGDRWEQCVWVRHHTANFSFRLELPHGACHWPDRNPKSPRKAALKVVLHREVLPTACLHKVHISTQHTSP
jgi:hypothetical protein